MNVEQMKRVLEEILLKTDLTPCVVGHRGVGKSAGIHQVCQDLGRAYVSLRLGQMEVGDLVGIPYRQGELMHWSRPSWWPADDGAAAVIHCDELNRAQQEDTLQAIFQFVEPPLAGLRRALHTHTLDPKHKVVVSINPPDGSYQVASLDRALLDRMVMIYVETDHRCWADYAHKNGFDRDVLQFLAGQPSFLSRQGSPVDMQMEPTERAWEMVSILRKNCRFEADLEMEVYAGIIGQEAAVSFLRWSREKAARPVGAMEVLNSWQQVREKVLAQADDAQAVTSNELVATLSRDPHLCAEAEKNLVAYIAVLPRDARFALVKSLVQIPDVAAILCKDEYDAVILDAVSAISSEADGRSASA